MFKFRPAGDHLYGNGSLAISLMLSYFALSFLPRDAMDEIWD